jgi:hypothetical protein
MEGALWARSHYWIFEEAVSRHVEASMRKMGIHFG